MTVWLWLSFEQIAPQHHQSDSCVPVGTLSTLSPSPPSPPSLSVFSAFSLFSLSPSLPLSLCPFPSLRPCLSLCPFPSLCACLSLCPFLRSRIAGLGRISFELGLDRPAVDDRKGQRRETGPKRAFEERATIE